MEQFGEKLAPLLLSNLEKIINKYDFQYLELQGAIVTTLATIFLYMTSKKVAEYSPSVVSALLMMQLKISDEDDIRWSCLYDSWINLLKVLPPANESIRDSVMKIILYGFEHVNKLKLQVPEADTAKEQHQPVCSYEKMAKAMRLAASLGRMR